MSNPVWDLQQKIYYGGYQLPVASINYTSRAEYDSTGNVLQGYTTTFSMKLFISETSAANTLTRLNNLLAILSRPRQTFEWVFNDAIVFKVDAATEFDGPRSPLNDNFMLDRRWGPKPKVKTIEKMVNGKSAKLSVDIECFCNHCPGTTCSDFEEAWWTFSYGMDLNYSCTRTVNGKYRLRSPLNAGDLLRNSGYFPPLPKSFQRHDIKYDLSADGLVLTFTVTDKQKWRTYPRPITDGNAVFSISQQMGMMTKSLRGSFEAPNDVNKRVIVQFIMALIAVRFPALANGDASEWITEFKIENDEFNNKVGFSVQTKTNAEKVLKNGKLRFSGMAEAGWSDVADILPGVDPETGIPDQWEQIDGFNQLLPMTGTASLIPYASQPFQMCDPNSNITMDEWSPYGTPPTYEGGPGLSDESQDGPTPSNGDPPPGDKETIWSPGHEEAPYESYQETIQYIMDYGIVAQFSTGTTGGNIVQQMHQPKMTIIQAGCASRYKIPPAEGQLIYAGSMLGDQESAYVSVKKVDRTSPQFIGDGVTPLHRCSWCYTIVVPSATKLNEAGSGNSDSGNVDVLIPPNLIIDYNNAYVLANAQNYYGAVKSPNTTVNSDGTFTGYYPGK